MASFQSQLITSTLHAAADSTDLALIDLLQAADGCTHRVPAAARRVREPAAASKFVTSGGVQYGRIFWHGRHSTGWSAPLGKLHKQGLQLLCNHGWQR
eukprot:5299682-Amphidinium_carterae.1